MQQKNNSHSCNQQCKKQNFGCFTIISSLKQQQLTIKVVEKTIQNHYYQNTFTYEDLSESFKIFFANIQQFFNQIKFSNQSQLIFCKKQDDKGQLKYTIHLASKKMELILLLNLFYRSREEVLEQENQMLKKIIAKMQDEIQKLKQNQNILLNQNLNIIEQLRDFCLTYNYDASKINNCQKVCKMVANQQLIHEEQSLLIQSQNQIIVDQRNHEKGVSNFNEGTAIQSQLKQTYRQWKRVNPTTNLWGQHKQIQIVKTKKIKPNDEAIQIQVKMKEQFNFYMDEDCPNYDRFSYYQNSIILTTKQKSLVGNDYYQIVANDPIYRTGKTVFGIKVIHLGDRPIFIGLLNEYRRRQQFTIRNRNAISYNLKGGYGCLSQDGDVVKIQLKAVRIKDTLHLIVDKDAKTISWFHNCNLMATRPLDKVFCQADLYPFFCMSEKGEELQIL